MVTTWVKPSEPAYGLIEVELTPFEASKAGKKFRPESWSGRHRMQIVYVNREDKLAEYWRDMGNAADYRYGQLRIPSFWEHTVEELRFIADDVRSRGNSWQRQIIADRQGESDLLEQFLQQRHETIQQLAMRSVFGPFIVRQRNISLDREKVRRGNTNARTAAAH